MYSGLYWLMYIFISLTVFVEIISIQVWQIVHKSGQ